MALHIRSMLAGAAISALTALATWLVLETGDAKRIPELTRVQSEDNRITQLEEQLVALQSKLAQGVNDGANAGASATVPQLPPRVEATRVTEDVVESVDPHVRELMRMQWLAACDDRSGLRDVLLRLGKCPTDKGVFAAYLKARGDYDDLMRSWSADNEKLRIDAQQLREAEGGKEDPEGYRNFARNHPELQKRSNDLQQTLRDDMKRIQDSMQAAIKASE